MYVGCRGRWKPAAFAHRKGGVQIDWARCVVKKIVVASFRSEWAGGRWKGFADLLYLEGLRWLVCSLDLAGGGRESKQRLLIAPLHQGAGVIWSVVENVSVDDALSRVCPELGNSVGCRVLIWASWTEKSSPRRMGVDALEPVVQVSRA